MIIEKNGKYYNVTERQRYWSITQKTGKLTAEFNVSKDICMTEDDLKKYIAEDEMFGV